METWLLTWNPKYFDWENPDDETEAVSVLRETLEKDGTASMTWSCGPNKRIKIGDRIFIIRLGVEPKGMVASGYAVSNVYEMPHWDPIKAAAGEWKRYIDVRFDKVLSSERDKILPLQMLRIVSPLTHWTPICSGMHIPDDVVAKLNDIWKDF